MMRRVFVSLALCLAIGPALGPARAAASSDAALVGRWDRDDGLGGVRIAPCGDALCGDVVWLKHPEGPAHVGERLLFDLRRTAGETSASDETSARQVWTGAAVNPEDRGTYAGTVLLDGDHATMRGCAAFGLICRSVKLTRVGTAH